MYGAGHDLSTFVAMKVQTKPASKRQRKAFGLSIPKLH
jgi:hypothetical protein